MCNPRQAQHHVPHHGRARLLIRVAVAIAVTGLPDPAAADSLFPQCVQNDGNIKDVFSQASDDEKRAIVAPFLCAGPDKADPDCCPADVLVDMVDSADGGVDGAIGQAGAAAAGAAGGGQSSLVRMAHNCAEVTEKIACKKGFYNNTSSGRFLACPAGFFCPGGLSCKVACPEGAYCPGVPAGHEHPVRANESTREDPNDDCAWLGLCCPLSLDRLPLRTNLTATGIDLFTNPRFWRCPGNSKPTPCPAKHYCPHPANATPISCPSNHYCRDGSVAPRRCSIMSSCPTDSGQPSLVIGGTLLVIGTLLVALAVLTVYLQREWLHTTIDGISTRLSTSSFRRMLSTSADLNDETSPDVELLGAGQADDAFSGLIEEKSFKIEFGFEDMGLALKGSGAKVLAGVSGAIKPHCVTAVMGPSGAGKTTFLSTLAGKAYYGTRSGTVLINGVADPISKFKKVVGFVPQEDVMHRRLTVREVLFYQAMVRLPRGWSEHRKRTKVSEVIQLLQLDDVADSAIGDEVVRGVSGGQRKRVNIGMELVADPTVLFLDEPTSGLDSTSSLAVLQALKRLAQLGGMTIVAVLHQPRYEIFEMFDEILLLAKGGRTVYLGPTMAAGDYFGVLGYQLPKHVNPPDFYMDVIAAPEMQGNQRDLVVEWETRRSQFLADHAAAALTATTTTTGAASNAAGGGYTPRQSVGGHKQLWIFFKRELVLQLTKKWVIVKDVILLLIGAAVVGMMYRNVTIDKTPLLLFTAALVYSLCVGLAFLPTFGHEKQVFWRESARGINKPAYFSALNVAGLPVLLALTTAYTGLLYSLVSPRIMYGNYLLAFMLAGWAVSGYSYLISIAASPMNAQLYTLVANMVLVLCCGVNPTLKTIIAIPVLGPAISSLSPARWLIEAIVLREFKKVPQIQQPTAIAIELKFGWVVNDADARFATCMAVLFCLGLASRIAAYATLVLTNRGAQK